MYSVVGKAADCIGSRLALPKYNLATFIISSCTPPQSQKMPSAQVDKFPVTNNAPFHNYPHPDDHTRCTTDTVGFK